MPENITYSNGGLIPGLPDDLAMECLVRIPISSRPTLALVSHGWKSAISDPSFHSHRRRVRSAEHLLCLIQPHHPPPPPLTITKTQQQQPPLHNLNIYNLTRPEWRRLILSLQIPVFSHCVSLPAVGKIVILGGWDPSTLEPVAQVLVVDLATGTYELGSPMPTARSFFACAAVGSTTVYVAGGHDGQKNSLWSADVYDVVCNTWRALPAMAEERDECQGFCFPWSTKFWVISGYGTESQGRYRSDGEVYDPEIGSWSRIDGVWPHPSTSPRASASVSTTTSGGGQWLFAGEGEVREYDWEEKRWKEVDSGRVPKSICLVDVGDGRVLAMGKRQECGEDDDGVFFMLERDDKGKGNWKQVDAPSTFLGLPFSASNLVI